MTLKEEIEKAIKMLDEMLHDIEEVEWGEILHVSYILSRVLDRLEVIHDYMRYLVNKILEENDVEMIRYYAENLRKQVQRLA
ncbi:MAG: hypothetical protein JZD41_07600 [Thermoproteus sp.]|nr:hypothetical protein [Thermoproteus sp.]